MSLNMGMWTCNIKGVRITATMLINSSAIACDCNTIFWILNKITYNI